MKDPVNINKNGIDDEILVFLYRNILLFYERFLKAKGSGYSVRSKIFKKVKKEFELHWFVVDTIGAFKCAYTEKNLSEMKGGMTIKMIIRTLPMHKLFTGYIETQT